MESTTTIRDFVKAHGLSMTVEPATSNPNMDDAWGKDASHWRCHITKGNHTITAPFSQGAAHRVFRKTWHGMSRETILGVMKASTWGEIAGKRVPMLWNPSKLIAEDIQQASEPAPPTIDSVLDCLAIDSSSFDDAKDFETWAADFGFDTDSRKAEKAYRTCGDQAKRLRHLLGDEAYAELLYKVERL